MVKLIKFGFRYERYLCYYVNLCTNKTVETKTISFEELFWFLVGFVLKVFATVVLAQTEGFQRLN